MTFFIYLDSCGVSQWMAEPHKKQYGHVAMETKVYIVPRFVHYERVVLFHD